MVSDDLRDRIDAAIRPNMLVGLQDAELDSPGGRQRINEWADWISLRVAELVQPELDRLTALLRDHDSCGTCGHERHRHGRNPIIRRCSDCRTSDDLHPFKEPTDD